MPRKAEASLLGLPAELRNLIYELVVHHNDGSFEADRTFLPPAIARVCCQTRTETLPMFYSQRLISFGRIVLHTDEESILSTTSTQGFEFMRQLFSPATMSQLRNIWIELVMELPGTPEIHVYYLGLDFANKTAWVRHAETSRVAATRTGETDLKMLLEAILQKVVFEGRRALNHKAFIENLATELREWYSYPTHASCFDRTCGWGYFAA